MRTELGLAFKIEVDGGVAHDTVAQVVQAGAELLVAGNAVFGAGQAERDARDLLAAARGSRESQLESSKFLVNSRNGRGSFPLPPMRWYEPVVEKLSCVGAGIAAAVGGCGPKPRKRSPSKRRTRI